MKKPPPIRGRRQKGDRSKLKNYEIYLNRLVSDGIEAKCSLEDILLEINELSSKLDIFIALKKTEEGHRP